MAALVDDDSPQQLAGHVEQMSERIKYIQEILRSARTWPWKRSEVPRLLYQLAGAFVERATDFVRLGRQTESSSDLWAAFICHEDRMSALEDVKADYEVVRGVCGGLLSGDFLRVARLAERFYSASNAADTPRTDSVGRENVKEKMRHGTAALLAWVCGRSEQEIASHAQAVENGSPIVEQFGLWARCALAGIRQDVDGVSEALRDLDLFLKREAAHDEGFAMSSDAHLYLPGMGLVRAAQRAGLLVEIPKGPAWHSELLPGA